jgi:hypothetical protein
LQPYQPLRLMDNYSTSASTKGTNIREVYRILMAGKITNERYKLVEQWFCSGREMI